MNITTPCHNAPLAILVTIESRSWVPEQVPDEIICTAEGCYNSWNADGTEA